MINPTILVVDDEKEICDLIEIYLKNENYNVIKSGNGIDALKKLKSENIHLIILDIMLPEIDGMQILKRIREDLDVPVIMLSAKREDNDKISGIINGADDYVTKPFNPLELVVRVKAQLRRYMKSIQRADRNVICIDDLIINVNSHTVKCGHEEIQFTSKEFEILNMLAQNKGMVFSSRQIYETIWNEEFYESDSTIMTHIKNIREKLHDNFKKTKYIKTVWGVGYKIE